MEVCFHLFALRLGYSQSVSLAQPLQGLESQRVIANPFLKMHPSLLVNVDLRQ